VIVNDKYKHSALTGKILGCAFEVHKNLGAGFQEVIYQRALQDEFVSEGINSVREFEMNVIYKDKIIGVRRVDFLVEGIISVEIKAVSKLDDLHLNQAVNYLEVYNLEIGMLLNFGSKSLKYRRLINSKYNSSKTINAKYQKSF
jgi:hypothetical protein